MASVNKLFVSLVGLVWLTTFCPAEAAAQPARSFEELGGRIGPGDPVHVTDRTGSVTEGEVESLSATSLVLTLDSERREFLAGQVVRIAQRQRGSLRQGLIIGISSGAALGFLAGRHAERGRTCSQGVECGQGALIGMNLGAMIGGGVGIIPALDRKPRVIYQHP